MTNKELAKSYYQIYLSKEQKEDKSLIIQWCKENINEDDWFKRGYTLYISEELDLFALTLKFGL